jgi:hypothetical protein
MSNEFKLLGLGILFFALGCNEDNELKDSKLLNSFSMNTNNQSWKPSIINSDSCYSTFQGEWSGINDKPFFRIIAYRDSQIRTNHESENILRVQIMNLSEEGKYNINDPMGDFTSYAMFIINESGDQKIYVNSDTKTSFIVNVDELFPLDGTLLEGISGAFSGILYNKTNSSDSIIIDNGKFIFKKVNWGNFFHCEE